MYKIASFEFVDIDLIKYVASTDKPLVISTGMATLREIAEAVEAAESAGASDITILKATSAYPAKPENANLSTLATLRNSFGYPVGISDHTLGIGVPIAAVTLGATMVKKHVTLDRGDGGVDSGFSLEPNEFAAMGAECNRAQAALGHIKFGQSEGEESTIKLRRSLILTTDVA